MTSDPSLFLGECDVIDFRSSEVARLAANLAGSDEKATAERCFRFVRDNIKHSSDYRLNPVTCSASAVLAHGTGYCYAKSHLLCALLRANKIPAGLCYQRLSIDGVGAPYCVHGLNAVCLPDVGWYRIDARGNRDGINAQFTPPEESLAFPTDLPGEFDLPGIYVAPLPNVVEALRKYDTWDNLYGNLPDMPQRRT
jgi:transglutaminase-like putative cysteine protease